MNVRGRVRIKKLLPLLKVRKMELTFHEDLVSIQCGHDISRPTLEHGYIYND